MENQPDTKKKREGRSPGYPGIDLQTAIERAKQIKDHEQKHFAPISIVCKHWGYSVGSGPALRTMSALLNFGLLEATGSGKDREFKISDSAWRILTDPRVDSPEKDTLIKEAALKPAIHKKLWEKHQGDFPSEDTFEVRLKHEEGFTESGAKEFIREFQSTLTFAKLQKTDSLAGHGEDKITEQKEGAMSAIQTPETSGVSNPTPMITTPTPAGPTQEFNMALSEGKTAYLRVPHALKRGDWEKIRKLLDVLEPDNESD
jgi:hypothetical protein